MLQFFFSKALLCLRNNDAESLYAHTVPETTFKRSTLLSEWVGPASPQQPASETSGQEPDPAPPIHQDKKEGTTQSEEKSKATQLDHLSIHSVTTPNPPSPPKRQTYWQSLAPYSGIRPTSASWFTLFSRPYIASITPVCLWAGIIYGVAITWLVLIATGVAQIFSAPREYLFLKFVSS